MVWNGVTNGGFLNKINSPFLRRERENWVQPREMAFRATFGSCFCSGTELATAIEGQGNLACAAVSS
jgi:hypothetical protein